MLAALLLLTFLAFAVAMAAGRLPALVALPALAVTVTLVAGLPHDYAAVPADAGAPARLAFALSATLDRLFSQVVTRGVPRLAPHVFVVLLGAVFGKMLEASGVARALVRWVAEMAGDRALAVTAALAFTVAVLFTALGGLGAVIMVADLIFPVLLSLGLPPLTVACVFLMSFSLGGVMNPVNWSFYKTVLGMPEAQVAGFAARLAGVWVVALAAFLLVELRRAKRPATGREVASVVGVAAALSAGVLAARAAGWAAPLHQLGRDAFLATTALVFLAAPRREESSPAALLAPLVPIAAVLLGGMGILPAFALGLLYLVRVSGKGRTSAMVSRAAIEGVEAVTPALCLLIGVGMVLVAVTQPPVKAALAPALAAAVPGSALTYVLGFGLLAPLALYRGPLNVYGMGSGLLGLVRDAGTLSPFRVMAAFLSTGQIQGVCDPTNTHNVWVASRLEVDLQEVLRRTLPWVWAVSILGLILGASLG